MKILRVNSKKGFTIVELLIATMVFSVILLIVTTGIIKLGNLYYKGVTASRTQDKARSISDEISRALQFADGEKTAGPIVANAESFCLGNTRYTAYKDTKSNGLATNSGLVSEEKTSSDSCDTFVCNGSCVPKQILGANMRILKLNINPVSPGSKAWQINLRIAYGDNDLLTHYNNDSTPVNNNPSQQLVLAETANCKSGIAGSSFCSIAQLDTVVKKRLK